VKSMKRVLTALIIFISFLFVVACGPSSSPAPKTEPEITQIQTPPAVEDLRKPVAKDANMFKVIKVIKEYGVFKKKYMSFEKYHQLTNGGTSGALDPDWFYDSYSFNMNEKNHFITITFGTSKRAKDRDDRIEKVMADLPENSISVRMKTPRDHTYLLTDAEADGILDYAVDEKNKGAGVDIKLLDAMQEKYSWIVSEVKKYYSKIKK